MKKVLLAITLWVAAVSINAQTVPHFNTEEEVYMYAKYNQDTILWNIFNQTQTEIKNSINFSNRYAEIELPFKTAMEARVKSIEDSLGVKRTDGAGDAINHKFYNPNADTAKVIAFLVLFNQIQQEYNTNITNATKDIQAEYYRLFEQALLDAVNRYFQNAQNVGSH
jgi:hypothetical protein